MVYGFLIPVLDQILADSHREVNAIAAGHIGAAIGLKWTQSGMQHWLCLC